MLKIAELWDSADSDAWTAALERYCKFVRPDNEALERSLEALDLERLRSMDAQGWYDFLKDEYFRWKYTAPNRYASTTRLLRWYADNDALGRLDRLRHRLLALDTDDIDAGLATACAMRGLGTAGASGLLALMYPEKFGTVDQFVVKALRQVNGLPEADALRRMNPESLTTDDGTRIIGILRRKAEANNLVLGSAVWTPRKVDKVLWTFGR